MIVSLVTRGCLYLVREPIDYTVKACGSGGGGTGGRGLWAGAVGGII